MKAERVAVDALLIDPANTRQHGQRNLEAIKASLAKFGQQKPIVVRADNVVVAGNGTLEAARALGWEKVAVVRTKLSGAESTAYAIADNRSAELAEWNFEALSSQLQALVDEDFDMGALGWAEHELEPLLAADWSPPPVSDLPGRDASTAAKPLALTPEQREIFDAAVAKVREVDDAELTDGECLVVICNEYLAGE